MEHLEKVVVLTGQLKVIKVHKFVPPVMHKLLVTQIKITSMVKLVMPVETVVVLDKLVTVLLTQVAVVVLPVNT